MSECVRRFLVVVLGCLSVLLSGAAGGQQLVASDAGEFAQGRVFEDRNANRQHDPGEPGIAGVLVSNGVAVVKTDARGRYRLPVEDDTHIFVIKPRGYDTARDPQIKLARFYYHHRPDGTPDDGWRFNGVGPTGVLPEAIDFPLYPRQEPDAFNVVLMADPQVYHTEELGWFQRDVAPRMQEVDAAFGIALGDLVGDNLLLLDPYNQANALSPFPWYNVVGNHDLNFYAPDDTDSDATFERTFGPSTYAFQYAQAHFLVLNNVYWPGFHGHRKDGWPKRGGYSGRLRDQQLAFIENYLEHVPQDQAVVVCVHIPLVNPYSDRAGASTAQFGELMRLLSGHPHSLSFSGHTHVNFNVLAGAEAGYRPPGDTEHLHHNVGTASGSWYNGPSDERGVPNSIMRDGTPPGFAVARFDGPRYRVTYHPFDGGAEHQMLIHLPDIVEASSQRDQPISVHANVFNATAESRVRMRVVGTDTWIDMHPERMTDPQYESLHAERLAAIEADPEAGLRGMPQPMATDHHYLAELPILDRGLHLIEVESTDRYGQTARQQRPLRVVGSMSQWQALDRFNIREPYKSEAPATAPDPEQEPEPEARAPEAEQAMPMMIAHRGASHLAPENTLASIELAWELDADAVEFDVFLSRDNVIVLHHDKTTKRTAGVDLPVVEQDFAQLRQLDVGAWKGERWRGQRIVSLQRALRPTPPQKRVFVEVKCGPEVVPELLRVFAASGLEADQLILISFNHEVIRQFKQMTTAYRAYWLSSLKQDPKSGDWYPTLETLIQRAKQADADGLNLKAVGPVLKPGWMKAIREAELEAYVWTVDDPVDAQRLRSLGVQGITTNRPDWLRERLRESTIRRDTPGF